MPMHPAQQIKELYGVPFPKELRQFNNYLEGLTPELYKAFTETAGMQPVGVMDALGGCFLEKEPRYPALLHWRYQRDPPEFFTVLSGDSDGLHWGYWFDDPGKEPPVMAAFYARDGYEIWSPGATIIDAVRSHLLDVSKGLADFIASEPQEYTAEYQHQRKLIQTLLSDLPPQDLNLKDRRPTHKTAEGMGIVAKTKDKEAIQMLVEAKKLWFKEDPNRFEALAEAYERLDRTALARVARIHGKWPHLPRLDLREYSDGDYHSFADAAEAREKVTRLEVSDHGLTQLPEIGALPNLQELRLASNALTSLPDWVSQCKQLRKVDFTSNAFTTIPASLAELPNLEEISLRCNQIEGLEESTEQFAHLKRIELYGNPLSDATKASLKEKLPGAEFE